MERKKNTRLPLAVKIMAIILAVSLLLGGGFFACWQLLHLDRNGDDRCDLCGEFMCALLEQPCLLQDCRCLICGVACCTTDEAHHGWCICCGKDLAIPDASGHEPQDDDRDGLCDACGGEVSVPARVCDHQNIDRDGLCDHCGEAMCVLELEAHRITDCVCQVCDQRFHQDSDGDIVCDYCTVLLCAFGQDTHDFDGCVCTICGIEVHWEGVVHAFCGRCGERRPMTDRNGNDICDECGASHYDLSWGPDDDAPHGDADSDGLCDCCGEYICRLYGYDDIDEDHDGVCDYCDTFLCVDHHGRVYHYDDDADGHCDRCSAPL